MNLPVKIDTWGDKTGFKTASEWILFSPDKITSVVSEQMPILNNAVES